MLEKFDLQSNHALITGAAGLLGHEHAHALLECGASVILTDIDTKRLENNQKKLAERYPQERILYFEMDVSSKKSIESVSEQLEKKGIFVDILINNAAIDPKFSQDLSHQTRFENYSLDQWNQEVSIGLTGAMLCAQVFGPKMANKKKGVILNISSDLSVIAPDQRLYQKPSLAEDMQPVKPVTYSVIKTGLIGLTRYLASYWALQGVRVNALSPGGVYVNQSEDFVQKLSSLIPMKRMAKSNEYRATVQYLCSDASSYMTGQNLVVDGGRSIL